MAYRTNYVDPFQQMISNNQLGSGLYGQDSVGQKMFDIGGSAGVGGINVQDLIQNLSSSSEGNSILDFLRGNSDTLNMFGQGLMGAANIYSGLQANKMAKKQFKFSKDFANKNLANQTQAYNTNLENQARRNISGSGWDQAQKDSYIQEYLEKNRLR